MNKDFGYNINQADWVMEIDFISDLAKIPRMRLMWEEEFSWILQGKEEEKRFLGQCHSL